jgi:hypothetical protein
MTYLSLTGGLIQVWYAAALAERLERQGFVCFLDRDETEAGRRAVSIFEESCPTQPDDGRHPDIRCAALQVDRSGGAGSSYEAADEAQQSSLSTSMVLGPVRTSEIRFLAYCGPWRG